MTSSPLVHVTFYLMSYGPHGHVLNHLKNVIYNKKVLEIEKALQLRADNSYFPPPTLGSSQLLIPPVPWGPMFPSKHCRQMHILTDTHKTTQLYTE